MQRLYMFPWFLFLREDSSLLECATDSSKSTSPSPSMTSLCLLLLAIQSSRWLGVAWELPRIVIESWEVCIALLFVGIDSANRDDLGSNLGGLGLKESRLFVSSSMKTYATFVVGWTWGTNLVSLLFNFHCIFVFFMFLSSRYRVSYFSLC
jgi:hypothetical protein